MYATERQQRILAEARAAGRVEVTALADALAVTPETIRRDLTALESRGSVRRVHGGAIPVERLEIEPTLASRTQRRTDVKRRIAARVLEELPTGGTVILDAGSTTQAIVELLPHDAELTVITDSLPAATVLATRPGITLYLLGGRVRGVTAARYAEGSNVIVIDPGVTDVFPDSASVNAALKALAKIIRRQLATGHGRTP